VIQDVKSVLAWCGGLRRDPRRCTRILISLSKIEITELQGDGIGPELANAVHEVADSLPDIDFDFVPFDWSLENREKRGEAVIDEAAEDMHRTRLALKYPTVTKNVSPNAQIRRKCGFSVIYRPAISIKGIDSNFKEDVNLHVVRIATGGTYDDPGQTIGRDAAVSLRLVEREPCAQAATFAFELGRKKGWTVTSSSKHTIQKVTDGLFEEVVRDIGEDYTDVAHNVELFDALLAKVIIAPENYQVVLVLNEYGDFLSDMASGLVGSLGTGASANFSFTPDRQVHIAMFDPAGGTAPDIAGKNLANPTAIFLAFGMLLDHIDRYDLGHAIRMSILGLLEQGICTGDLGGKLSTDEFTREVINHLPENLTSQA